MNLIDKLSLVILVLTLGAQILYRRSFWSLGGGIRNNESLLRQKTSHFAKATRDKTDGQVGVRDNELGITDAKWGVAKYFSDNKSFSSFLRIAWIISVLAIFGTLVYWAVLQYRLWAGNDLTKTLLPPYQSFGYFYSYVGKRFFAPWLIALLFAIVVSRVSKLLNKKYGERFFENEEIELISFGIFLTGYPGFFIYLILILVLGVLFSTFFTLLNFFLEKLGRASSLLSKGRLPLYYFWIPTAILAIIIKLWLFPLLGLTHYLGNFAF